jgi:flagellar basal-body rod protein FlgC
MDLNTSIKISAAGMQAQSVRLRTIAENIANSDSAPTSPEGSPYRRKIVSFRNLIDRALGVETVRVNEIRRDPAEFPRKLDPTHPAADTQGYVAMPNVDRLVEAIDMREAHRSYQANLSALEIARGMMQRALDILRR